MSAGPRTVSSRWIWIFWNGAAEESVAMAARGCRRRRGRGQRELKGPVVVLERKAEEARRSRCAVAIPFSLFLPRSPQGAGPHRTYSGYFRNFCLSLFCFPFFPF